MFAALLLQSSLLVAPMHMSDAPPQTRACAILGVPGERERLTAAFSSRRFGDDIGALARRAVGSPTPDLIAQFGTFTDAMLPPSALRSLNEHHENPFDPEAGTSQPVELRGGWGVVQALERDAACKQIFVAGTDDLARAKADAILRELRAGADFAAIARTRSDDRASALRGGDFAIFEREPSDALLREAAFNTKVGELNGPIASPLGFHILKRVPVDELDPRLRDDVWARVRGILVAFGGAQGADPQLVREQVDARAIAEDFAARILRGEDMGRLASELNDDRGGRERKGDLGWVRRATTQMPQFFDKLFQEPPGTLIGPIASNAGFVLLRREDPGPRTRIDLRMNAFVDLEQWVRKLAENKGDLPEVDGLEAAVLAARALDASFGSPLEWGRIEGHLVHSPNAADFARHCAALPESVTSISGRPVPLRDLALAFANALVVAEKSHATLDAETQEERGSNNAWPAHEAHIKRALLPLRRELALLGDVALDELRRGLGMASDPRVIVPVYLVAEAPRPGGVTHRARDGAVCLIDADEQRGTQLVEIVLHEASHALELATEGQTSALTELRERLKIAGLDPRDRAMRDVPHTLMFVTSAWVVRRVFDPAHEDYGDVAGYYARVPAATAAVRATWTEFLDGKRTREDALAAIVAATSSAK